MSFTEKDLMHFHDLKIYEFYPDEELEHKFNIIELMPISDVHLGDNLCMIDLLIKNINWAKEKENRFIILNGDIMNTAIKNSVSDIYSETLTPHEQLKKARELFLPVRNKIISCTSGNHENRIYKETGVDISEELANTLECFYESKGIYLKIKFGKKDNGKPQVYSFYHTHGSAGGNKIGSKANKLDELQNIILADCYIISHTHQQLVFPKVYFVPDLRNNKIQTKIIKKINSGHYLKYGGYGQTKNYSPTPPGSSIIKLYAKEKKIEIIS